MKEKGVNIKDVVLIGGAYIAFQIGSGFATGQEIMQFFTSYGYYGFAAAMISMLIFVFMGVFITKAGKEHNLDTQSKAFTHYCGKTLGNILGWFNTALMFCVYTIMLSGAGATISEYYGLNPKIGTIIMAILAVGTVLMGLNKLVDIIGSIGPLIIIFSAVIGIISGIANFDGFLAAGEVIKTLDVPKAAPNWLISGFLYGCYPLVTMIPFLASLGVNAKNKETALRGGAFGGATLLICVAIMNFGLLASIGNIHSLDIPSLYLAKQINPMLANIFSIILFAGIYTTAVPMLFMVTSKIFKEKTPKFNILAVILTITAIIGGTILPFGQLVGTVYPYTGYIGIGILVCVIYKTFFAKKQ